MIKRFVSYFTAAAMRNSRNQFRMVRNKISLTLNYGPVSDRLKISFLMISEINPFMTETDIKSMDWFLYDIGLRHERVKQINSEIIKKHDFRENRSLFPSVRLILEVKFGDNPLIR